MPLTRVSLRRGKPAAYRKAILESLYRRCARPSMSPKAIAS